MKIAKTCFKLTIIVLLTINIGELTHAAYSDITFVSTDSAGYDDFSNGIVQLSRYVISLAYIIPTLFLIKKKKYAWYFLLILAFLEATYYSLGYELDRDLPTYHRLIFAISTIILLIASRKQLSPPSKTIS
jgi:hypothetical protein